MIPSMNPPIQSSDTYRLDLVEPLSMEDQLLVHLLTQRFEGVECPFLTFSRDGFTTVVYPRTVRGKLPQLGGPPAIPKNIESQHS